MDLSLTNKISDEETCLMNTPIPKPINNSHGVQKLRALLNKALRIEMSDGRILIGIFLCTDADANLILGSCSEYLSNDSKLNKSNDEPRMLGLVMVPGKHIVTVSKDLNDPQINNALNTSSFEYQGDVI